MTLDTTSDTWSNFPSVRSEQSSISPSLTAARRRPDSLRLNHIGIDPSEVIGKVLQRARRSSTHPVLMLDFSDNTTVQVLVDGYDPTHRGIPKELEMDSDLSAIFSNTGSLGLEIIDCAFITLQDAAFDRKHAKSPSKGVRWDQNHLAVALKFSQRTPRWHCIWARMEEYDEELGICVFRSYDDVYLENLHRAPKANWRKSLSQRQDATQ